MPERSDFEQKLHDEQLACRRCVAALDKVDPAGRGRIVVEASYFTLRSRLLRDHVVHRTVEIRSDLLVDVDEQGQVFGIERIGGYVDMGDLAALLAAAVLTEEAPMTEIPIAALGAAFEAAWPGLPECISTEEAHRRSDAAVRAAAKVLTELGWLDPTAAQALRTERDEARAEVERLTDAAVIVACEHPELDAAARSIYPRRHRHTYGRSPTGTTGCGYAKTSTATGGVAPACRATTTGSRC